MKQNFKRDKFLKETQRKKKQEEKRNKRLHKKEADATPEQAGSGTLDPAL